MKNSFKLQLFLLVVVVTINTITCLKISTNYMYADENTNKTAKVALLSCANKNVSNAYYNTLTNEWIEAKLSTKCLQNSVQSVHKFCKRIYKSFHIVNVENIGKQVAFTVQGICDSNDVSCHQEVNADIYKCVFGEFEDKALFVPPNCEYNELNGDGNKCETQDYWLFKASETCKNSDKVLNASSLKKWCNGEENIGRFEGIQVVCCTSDEDDDIDDDEFDYDEDDSDEINNILSDKTEQQKPSKQQQQQQIVKVDLTKNENEVVKQQAQDQDDDASAIDGDQAELSRYKAEKQKINQEYEDKKSKYVNEWNDQRAKTLEINNKDENKLKLIDDKYNKQLKEIDEDHQRLLEQEDDLHENIVQSSINERKAAAKQNFDNELSKYQSQQTTSTERLLNAFKALFIAEERDRLHQITVYKRILDPSSENERVATIIRNLKLIDAQLSKCELEIRNVAGKQIDMKLSSLIDAIKADYADIRKESDKLIQDYDKPQQQVVNNNNNNKVDPAKLSDGKNKNNNNNNKEQSEVQTVNDIIEGNDDDDDDYDSSDEDTDSGEDSIEDTNNLNAAKSDATKPPSILVVADNNDKKVVIDDDGSIEEDQSAEDENVDDDSVEVSNNNNNKQSETNDKPSENNKDNDDDFESDEDDNDDSNESSSDEDDIQSEVVTNDKPVFKGNNPNKVDDSIQHNPLRDGNAIKTSTTTLFMYLAMGVCGTLFFVLILIGFMIRRGRSNYVQLQTPGDTYSPEEKHVSEMQQHGFVNPTYVALEKQV